jgi:hypothetical protein
VELARNASLRGHVFAADGQPLAGCRLVIVDGEQEIARGTSGADGGFDVPAPPRRWLSLRVFAPGAADDAPPVQVLPATADGGPLTVQLAR